jgi:hypothetical protein
MGGQIELQTSTTGIMPVVTYARKGYVAPATSPRSYQLKDQ